MADLQQYHLVARECSGRAVRVRQLSPGELDRVLDAAYKQVGDNGTMIQLYNAEAQIGVVTMIHSYSDPCERGQDMAPERKWTPVNDQIRQVLANDPLSLFNAKDWDLLGKIYQRTHKANPAEVEEIFTAARLVTTG